MGMRTFLAFLHMLNFLIGIFAAAYVLNSSWGILELWQISLYIYFAVLGFGGVLLASWIIMDGKHIESCDVEMQDLERRILDLERLIDRVTTERLSVSSTKP